MLDVSRNMHRLGILVLSLVASSAWGQGLARQPIDCDGSTQDKPYPQMSQFCAPNEYTNTCYNAFMKATREADEHNARARECRRRLGMNNPGPALRGRPDLQQGGEINAPARNAERGSGVADRLRTLSKQKAGEQAMTKQRLDQLRREHQQAITDSQAAYNQRQQQLIDEKRQLDADVAAQAADRARLRDSMRSKMVCYGDSSSRSSVQAGFRRCVAECRDYYDRSYCESTCDDVGSSDEDGQSCFTPPG